MGEKIKNIDDFKSALNTDVVTNEDKILPICLLACFLMDDKNNLEKIKELFENEKSYLLKYIELFEKHESCMDALITMKSIDIVIFAYENGCSFSNKSCEMAAVHGNPDILKYIIEQKSF